MNPGARIDLPEVAVVLGVDDFSFEIVSIHPGGMGVCVQLRHPEESRTFALKCIHPELLGDQHSIVRFRDEIEVWLTASACDAVAEALAVVRIDEMPAVVGRWLDAGDLAHALPCLSCEAQFESILRVCRALSWVHTNLGVIHRDLKPGNILIDRDLLAHVSDWGLARPLRNAIAASSEAAHVAPLERPERTQRGSFLGTALYAAPEQFFDASSVDHRADIYALGCIMHELEAGAPPFVAPDVPAIARMHLHQTPPRLGGLFKRTKLGLERVITRCLAKKPSERYQFYAELEADLLSVAKSRGFSTSRCHVGVRKEVHQLGKGQSALDDRVANAPVKGRGVVALEFDDIAPFLKEAEGLMALGRYTEAETLLRGTYVPELSSGSGDWTMYHTFAAQYALCIQHIRGRLAESLVIFDCLGAVRGAPAEFFVNYSLALLRGSEWARAIDLCEMGLAQYANDLDILGNYTIALTSVGNVDRAMKIAMQRLAKRRDVHALDEAAGVLEVIRDGSRNSDLPSAVAAAEAQSRLITEGLGLNPQYAVLRLARIRLLRFAYARNMALDACDAMMHENGIQASYRQHAFAECVDIVADGDDPAAALQMIDKQDTQKMHEAVMRRVSATRRRVLTNMMIERTNDDGVRLVVRDVAEHVLADSQVPDREAVTRARALEWMGHLEEAEATLRNALENPDLSKIAWDARRQFVRLLRGQGRLDEAMSEARLLTELGPWRAGSYDELRRVAEKCGNRAVVQTAKEMGDRVYEEESKLFQRLRESIR